MSIWIDIAVQAPAHSQVGGLLTYRSPVQVQPGQLVRVPFGQREVLGVVWAIREGRQAARSIDEFLMGTSDLPR